MSAQLLQLCMMHHLTILDLLRLPHILIFLLQTQMELLTFNINFRFLLLLALRHQPLVFQEQIRDFLILLPALIPRHLLKVIKFVFNYNLLMHLQISKLIIGGCERVTLVVQMNMVNGLLLRA